MRLLKKNSQVILRIDPITEEIARGEDGLCIRVSFRSSFIVAGVDRVS